MKIKKILSMVLAAALYLTVFAGCGSDETERGAAETDAINTDAVETKAEELVDSATETVVPKYVFLFIGDGTTYPQFQIASSYLSALAETDDILDGSESLSFMEFPIAGSSIWTRPKQRPTKQYLSS